MPHAFDGNFEQILADSRRLIAHARRHEQTLAEIVTLLESHGAGRETHADAAPPLTDAEFAPAPEWPASRGLLALIRTSCVGARQQREVAERVLLALLGDLPAENGRARILIVDDAEDNRELAAMVLEHSGFHAVTASNGLEGVIAAHCVRPAAVLMDVTMPVLDGIEAARLLRASASTRSLPVIAYTANPEVYEGPLTRLFAGVLGKPATPEAIVAKVRESFESP